MNFYPELRNKESLLQSLVRRCSIPGTIFVPRLDCKDEFTLRAVLQHEELHLILYGLPQSQKDVLVQAYEAVRVVASSTPLTKLFSPEAMEHFREDGFCVEIASHSSAIFTATSTMTRRNFGPRHLMNCPAR
jgi:hypothetical protein